MVYLNEMKHDIYNKQIDISASFHIQILKGDNKIIWKGCDWREVDTGKRGAAR